MNVPFLSGRRRTGASAAYGSGSSRGVVEKLAVICPRDLALAMADQKLRGVMDFPEPTSALVVVTGLENSPLERHHRDLLWRAFGLPVFEELRGPDGRILARECEVHDGMHIEDESGLPAGVEMVTALCECGNQMPRLRAASAKAHKVRAATA